MNIEDKDRDYYMIPKDSDIELRITINDGRVFGIFALKSVLTSKSPVFQQMFASRNFAEARTNIVNITVSGGEDVALAFIRYFYDERVTRGNLSLSMGLLRTSHMYQIDELSKICESCISERITPNNVCQAYQEINTFGSDTLRKETFALMIRCAFLIFQRNYHFILSKEQLASMLKSDFLNAINEDLVVDAVWRWGAWNCYKIGQAKPSKQEVIERIGDLRALIRWNNVQRDRLQQVWHLLAVAHSADNLDSSDIMRIPKEIPSICRFAETLEFKLAATVNHEHIVCRLFNRSETLLTFFPNNDLCIVGLDFEGSVDVNPDDVIRRLQLKIDNENIRFRCRKKSISKEETTGHGITSRTTFTLQLEMLAPLLVPKSANHLLAFSVNCEHGVTHCLQCANHRAYFTRYRFDHCTWCIANDTTSLSIFANNVLCVTKLYFFPFT